jgi:hypothetical protein
MGRIFIANEWVKGQDLLLLPFYRGSRAAHGEPANWALAPDLAHPTRDFSSAVLPNRNDQPATQVALRGVATGFIKLRSHIGMHLSRLSP